MEFRQNLCFRQFLIIFLLSSLVAGCGEKPLEDGSKWAPPINNYPNDTPKPALPEISCDNHCNRIKATQKIRSVKRLLNNGKHLQAIQEIETWTLSSEPWKDMLINSPGDMITYLPLAIAFNKKDLYNELLKMDNNQTNETTDYICATASIAWTESSRFLRCLYESKMNREKCRKYEEELLKKYPESIKMINEL